jgi:ankyrin repeat protein
LPIYLETGLQGSLAIPQVQRIPILHNVVGRLHFDQYQAKNCVDLAEMVHILLAHGADTQTQYEGLTPFQALFLDRNPTSLPKYTNFTEPMKQVAELFLQHGSDPNADVFYFGHNIANFAEESADYTSKPLHVAVKCPDTAQLLLQFGANVSGLNGEGRTPLDLCVLYATPVFEDVSFGIQTDQNLIETVETLVRNGGKMMHQALEAVEYRGDLSESDIEKAGDKAVERWHAEKEKNGGKGFKFLKYEFLLMFFYFWEGGEVYNASCRAPTLSIKDSTPVTPK